MYSTFDVYQPDQTKVLKRNIYCNYILYIGRGFVTKTRSALRATLQKCKIPFSKMVCVPDLDSIVYIK